MSHECGWCLWKQLLGNFLAAATSKLTPCASQCQREGRDPLTVRLDKGAKTRHCAAISVFKADCTSALALSPIRPLARPGAPTHSELMQPFALLICSVPQTSIRAFTFSPERRASLSDPEFASWKRAAAGNPRKELVLQIAPEESVPFCTKLPSSGSVCVWEGK